MKHSQYGLVLTALALSNLWGATPARAAVVERTGSASADSGETDSTGLQEVIVSATRRHTPLERTPVAVSAISGRQISDRMDQTLFDLAPQLPGLTMNGSAGYDNFPLGIRGIASSTSLIGSEDPVAVYLDGVYLGKPSAVMVDLLDVNQIQVIRGPQGTLYGRDATAGAILITQRHPSRHPELTSSASFGNFGQWRLASRVSGPLSDSWSGTLAVAHSGESGWGANTFNGSKAVSRQSTSGVGALAFDRGSLHATLRVDGLTERIHDAFKKINAVPYSAAHPNIADDGLAGNPSSFAFNFPTGESHDDGGASLEIAYDMPGATLKSITGWRFDDLRGSIDTDGTATSITTNVTNEHHHQFSQSLTLSGNNSHNTWITGIDGYHATDTLVQVVGVPVLVSSLTISAREQLTAVGAFFEYTQKFGDQFALTAGARINEDHKDFTSAGNGAGRIASAPAERLTHAWTSVTPSARATYTPNKQLLLYVTIGKGFKSGGMTVLQATPFNPETVWNYEAGLKWTSANRHVYINADGYREDYKNLQVRVSRGLGLIQTLNAAAARINGAEFETGVMLPGGLRLSAFANFTDARYVDYIGPGPFNNAGQSLNRAPKWQTGATVGFDRDTPIGIVSGELIYSERTRIYFSAPNVNGLSSPGYGQLDARLGYDMPSGSWRFSLVGKNLTDQRHVDNVVIFGSTLAANFNEPRSVMAEVEYRLGQ
ncbi:MAG: TonB-dependent receptor [Proteobacteria bacterium]|nr:TonB-dependent receptor [Pseudomonadota bacterium]